MSPASLLAASNTLNKGFVSIESASLRLDSTQPLPLADQNLHLNIDADSTINTFFDNNFVPDHSKRHLDAIEPLPLLPQNGSSRKPHHASSAAITLQLLDKIRERILSRYGYAALTRLRGIQAWPGSKAPLISVMRKGEPVRAAFKEEGETHIFMMQGLCEPSLKAVHRAPCCFVSRRLGSF